MNKLLIVSFFVLMLNACGKHQTNSEDDSSHKKLQELVDSISATISPEKNMSASLTLEEDTVWNVMEITSGINDPDKTKAMLHDIDVRRMYEGQMIASYYVYEPNEQEKGKGLDPKTLMTLIESDKAYFGIKIVTPYGSAKDTYSPDEIVKLRDKYLPMIKKEVEERKQMEKEIEEWSKK